MLGRTLRQSKQHIENLKLSNRRVAYLQTMNLIYNCSILLLYDVFMGFHDKCNFLSSSSSLACTIDNLDSAMCGSDENV